MPDSGFWPGQQITLEAVFKTTAGVEIDVTTGLLYYQEPGGTVTTKTIAQMTKRTTGTYYYLVTVTSSQSGEWLWGCKGTQGAIGSNLGGRFRVLESTLST